MYLKSPSPEDRYEVFSNFNVQISFFSVRFFANGITFKACDVTANIKLLSYSLLFSLMYNNKLHYPCLLC